MFEILLDTTLDVLKLIPFLFITYLIMEYIENKTEDKAKKIVKKSGKFGPLIGGLVGIFPQCGFSASATSLYAARVISLGTLISVYLSTSDEMIPIFISETVPIEIIIKILSIKFAIGMVAGFIIDAIIRITKKGIEEKDKIVDLCKNEHCHCKEEGIFKSALRHTINITIYIFIITFIINIFITLIGEYTIENFVSRNAFLGPIISSLIGLIPNCAASVIITNLYLKGVINAAALIAGLLTGAGIGLIVLFKTNKNMKENIKIIILIYFIGALAGIILQAMNFVI